MALNNFRDVNGNIIPSMLGQDIPQVARKKSELLFPDDDVYRQLIKKHKFNFLSNLESIRLGIINYGSNSEEATNWAKGIYISNMRNAWQLAEWSRKKVAPTGNTPTLTPVSSSSVNSGLVTSPMQDNVLDPQELARRMIKSQQERRARGFGIRKVNLNTPVTDINTDNITSQSPSQLEPNKPGPIRATGKNYPYADSRYDASLRQMKQAAQEAFTPERRQALGAYLNAEVQEYAASYKDTFKQITRAAFDRFSEADPNAFSDFMDSEQTRITKLQVNRSSPAVTGNNVQPELTGTIKKQRNERLSRHRRFRDYDAYDDVYEENLASLKSRFRGNLEGNSDREKVISRYRRDIELLRESAKERKKLKLREAQMRVEASRENENLRNLAESIGSPSTSQPVSGNNLIPEPPQASASIPRNTSHAAIGGSPQVDRTNVLVEDKPRVNPSKFKLSSELMIGGAVLGGAALLWGASKMLESGGKVKTEVSSTLPQSIVRHSEASAVITPTKEDRRQDVNPNRPIMHSNITTSTDILASHEVQGLLAKKILSESYQY